MEMGKKMETSENQKIKYARGKAINIVEIMGASSQALSQAFVGLAEGTNKVTEEVTKETRKLVKKKYGDDYVKTFIGSAEQKEEALDGKSDEGEEETPQIKQTESQETKLYPKLDEKKQ